MKMGAKKQQIFLDLLLVCRCDERRNSVKLFAKISWIKTLDLNCFHHGFKSVAVKKVSHTENLIVNAQIRQKQSCFIISVAKIETAPSFTLFIIRCGFIYHLKIYGMCLIGVYCFQSFNGSATIPLTPTL